MDANEYDKRFLLIRILSRLSSRADLLITAVADTDSDIEDVDGSALGEMWRDLCVMHVALEKTIYEGE